MTRRSFVVHLAALGSAAGMVRPANQAEPVRGRRIGLVFGDDPKGGVAAFREAVSGMHGAREVRCWGYRR